MATALLVACSSENPSLQLLEAADGGAEPESDAGAPETATRLDPILEGRKYRVQARNPVTRTDAELETFEVSFDASPRLMPEVALPLQYTGVGSQAADKINASDLVALACAFDVAEKSDFIVPSFDQAENPGSQISQAIIDGVEGFAEREVPAWPLQAIWLWVNFRFQRDYYTNSCNTEMHWTQAMNLCVADRYLELARADGPYEIVLDPITNPRNKLPAGDAPTYKCNDEQALNRCVSMSLTLQSAASLAEHAESRADELREYLLWPLSHGLELVTTNSAIRFVDGFNLTQNLPARGSLSNAEYVEALLPYYQRPIARYPIQEAADKATLAMLASNYYLAAQDIGQWLMECQLSGGPLPADQQWVDKYNHDAVRLNEVVVTHLVEAMQGSVTATELAQKMIMASASEKLAGSASEQANQLFWRGRTNSRLECVHAWTDLAPWLFQDEDATPPELDQSLLYPVFPWTESSDEVLKAERILRDARVDPRLVLNGGVQELANALRAALHEQMPYGFSDVDTSGDGLAVLAAMGIDQEDLRSAAFRIMDSNRSLGRAIVPLNSDISGVTADQPIEIPGEEWTGYFYTHGVARDLSPADRAFLYAQSVGVPTGNSLTLPSGDALYAYQGTIGGLAASQRVLQQLATNFGVPYAAPVAPFFVDASDPPPHTNPDISSDEEMVALTQSGISAANKWVPEIFGICPDGTTYFFSDAQNPEVPEVWRGEAGLECATKGTFGEVTCDPTPYRVTYATPPTSMGATRVASVGKFGTTGRLDLTGLYPSDRIYFTRQNGAAGRKAIVGVTLGNACNFYSFGEALLEKVNECLSVQPEQPEKPAECCEGLPCDLNVPLEDSLQSTPAREIESSFMHYLSLAREAATRADTLGEQLYRQGLDMDMRAEAARDELENLCGGVTNVDQLGPKPCETNEDCGDGQGDAMKCMPTSSLVSQSRYCTGGTVTETLRNASLTECMTNSDCGSAGVCVADGDTVRYCAPRCNPGPCDGQCTSSPNGSFCAQFCTNKEQCSEGMRCDTTAQICVPSPKDDLKSVEACLDLGEENALVPAAFGKKALHAWQFPGLPLCVCASGAECDDAFDPEDGTPICPSAVAEGPNSPFHVPEGAEYKEITTTLGFQTFDEANEGGVESCRALAALRVGLPEGETTLPDGRTLESLVAAISEQPWMTKEGYAAIGLKVIPFYDTYGFLTIKYQDNPWATTGSFEGGPLIGDIFPNEPMINATDPLCNGAYAPNAGYPLQCRSMNTANLALAIDDEELVRIVQVMHVLAGSYRIPIADRISYAVQPEDGEGEGRRYVLATSPSVPAGFVNRMAPNYDPAAVMRRVRVAGGDAAVEQILIGDGSDHKKNDNYYVYNPMCLSTPTNPVPSAVRPYMNDIGCGATEIIDGRETLVRFRAYANGTRANGLWAGNGSGAENETAGVSNALFNPTADGSLFLPLHWLATNFQMNPEIAAPIATQFWNTDEGPITTQRVMDALELACLISAAPRGPQVGLQADCEAGTGEPPTINGPRDFPKLTKQLRCAADKVDKELKRLWVPEIPKAIADAIRESTVTDTVPHFRGEYAESVSELQGAFQTVAESTRTIGSQLRAFANELALAQTSLEQIDREGKILNWKMVADISNQIAACGSSSSINGAAFNCANAAVQIASVVAINSLQHDDLDDEKRKALIQISMQFGDRLDTIQAASEALRTGYSDISRLQARIQGTRGKAERAMAKVLFLDRDATGRVYNVNTALRRNMNTLRERYDEALTDAKRMSFIARRAIEQRLAMSLEDLDDNLALVDPPSKWVNTACSMTGIDYERIRNADVTPVEGIAADDFSAGFIGDYVTKLENLVESYRFKYPFRDGTDVAVVSMRDELLGVKTTCDVAGPNMLYATSDMIVINSEEQAMAPFWHDASDPGRSVIQATMGASPRRADVHTDGPSPAPRVPGGTAYQMTAAAATQAGARGYWGQELFVDEGVYLLSWYERYGTSDDGCTTPPARTAPSVRGQAIGLDNAATVITETPRLVPLSLGTPAEPNLAEDFIQRCWRRWSAVVKVQESQNVGIRFGLQDDAVPAIWAQPQLERADSQDLFIDAETDDADTDAWPKAYFPTTDVLTAEVGTCEDTTGAAFQSRFSAGESFCEPICPDGTGEACAKYESTETFATQCYHEIRFEIGPGTIERGDLIPSIARSNFNYRYSRFGINLVGTGLRDCEQSASPSTCYGSGYVQYTLRHDGPFRVINHDGDRVDVALFPARIEHAKALTAERYVTNPISSADRGLMEDFWRSELRGRPLQGSYALRIYDIPGPDGRNVFDMDNLEDVQLIFEYNYWTRSDQ